jgi:predicted 3-demethylubiquinone-9 3-methyltransferase (glyoxalase superfamily)
MQNKITPFLWFEKDLPSVLDYYKNIFKDNAKVLEIGELQNAGHGDFQVGSMEIFGNKFDMMAAGPIFKFTEAISFTILCDNQEEVDYYWGAFTGNGGQESVCGWCKDKYGLSWQVVPKKLLELQKDSNKEIANYAMSQMMQMKKIIIKDLEK